MLDLFVPLQVYISFIIVVNNYCLRPSWVIKFKYGGCKTRPRNIHLLIHVSHLYSWGAFLKQLPHSECKLSGDYGTSVPIISGSCVSMEGRGSALQSLGSDCMRAGTEAEEENQRSGEKAKSNSMVRIRILQIIFTSQQVNSGIK